MSTGLLQRLSAYFLPPAFCSCEYAVRVDLMDNPQGQGYPQPLLLLFDFNLKNSPPELLDHMAVNEVNSQ